MKTHLRDCGLQAGTLHAPLRKNVLGAPEENWRVEKVGVTSNYLRLSGELGAGGMVIHPVPNPIFVENPDSPEKPQAIADAVRRSLDDLVPVAIYPSRPRQDRAGRRGRARGSVRIDPPALSPSPVLEQIAGARVRD